MADRTGFYMALHDKKKVKQNSNSKLECQGYNLHCCAQDKVQKNGPSFHVILRDTLSKPEQWKWESELRQSYTETGLRSSDLSLSKYTLWELFLLVLEDMVEV